jgi:formiminoglutamase
MFDFLEPLSISQITNDVALNKNQYGTTINIYTQQEIDWKKADIIIVGMDETRGMGIPNKFANVIAIRSQLYQLYCWHENIKIADIGNIKLGKNLSDSYAAIKIVISELLEANKKIIFLGGSHDLTLGLYYAFQNNKTRIEFTNIDAKINLSLDEPLRSENFLVEMLTSENNYVSHYNHLGFQSYFVHPQMMVTLDNLRFDCVRVGKVRQNIANYEPTIRNSNLVSIDISALQQAFMPCNSITPNGFAGDEACILTKYVGMSNSNNILGLFGYSNKNDNQQIGAIQLAQMIWYYIDGFNSLLNEKNSTDKENYNEFITAFADEQIVFYQNKENNKWWMQMPNGKKIACNYEDYVQASQNDMPEMWLRHQERLT